MHTTLYTEIRHLNHLRGTPSIRSRDKLKKTKKNTTIANNKFKIRTNFAPWRWTAVAGEKCSESKEGQFSIHIISDKPLQLTNKTILSGNF